MHKNNSKILKKFLYFKGRIRFHVDVFLKQQQQQKKKKNRRKKSQKENGPVIYSTIDHSTWASSWLHQNRQLF